MNCQSFELIITDLARNQIIEASVGQSALEHTDSCTVCAKRLADQKILTVRLRVLAAESATDKPSQAVEDALLNAFRVASKSNVAVAMGSTSARRLWRYAAVAAAIAVVAMSLYAYHIHQGNSRRVGAGVHPQNFQTKSQAGPSSMGNEKGVTETVADDHAGASTGNRYSRTGKPRRRPYRSSEKLTNIDTTVEFIALPTAGSLGPLESGQIVRVEVSRAALIAIGFPLSAERANESVKADLLLGQDGVARAIRFVQ